MENSRFKYVNYKGATEEASGGSLTLFVGIEYPPGVFTRLRFSSQDFAEIASGSDIISDPLPIDIPVGASFWEWTYATWTASSALYAVSSKYVDLSQVAASGLSDNTISGETTGMSPGNFVYGATAIVDKTNKPSVLILGDSRASGNNLAHMTNDLGPIAGAVGKSLGYINLAASGAAMWQFRVGASGKLTALSHYCSHVVIAGHISDINSGDDTTTVIANCEGLITKFAKSKPAFLCTVEPCTTSTDSWATEVNQAIWNEQKNRVRVSYNNAVREGKIAGNTGFFDLAKLVESVTNPGKWLALDSLDGRRGIYTSDGLHGNRAADLLMQKAVKLEVFRA